LSESFVAEALSPRTSSLDPPHLPRGAAGIYLPELTAPQRVGGSVFVISERVMTSLAYLLEESFEIAWNYLAASGEIDDAVAANRFLGRTIELMIRAGQRNRLLLSNRAISAYQRVKREQRSETLPLFTRPNPVRRASSDSDAFGHHGDKPNPQPPFR